MPENHDLILQVLVSGDIYLFLGRIVKFLLKTIIMIFCVSFILLTSISIAENNAQELISKIQYTEKQISELSEIPLYATKIETNKAQFTNKVDELIDLLEAHKKAAEHGQDIDRLEATVKEINELIEIQKTGPPKFSINDFHSSLCFQCHTVNDFSPSDKTQKQWRRLIEEDGHSIFEEISWDNAYQKNQILEFLIENAGTYRAEGIGVWN
jgi:hypothetical protein